MAKAAAAKVSYRKIHDEIIAARKQLAAQFPRSKSPKKEKLEAAIRNLDIATVLLECNQSLNATDYHIEPWKQLPRMHRLMKGGRAAKKK